MALTRKEEARALDAEGRGLVEKSHHPAVQDLSDAELGELLQLLRDRRDRAQRLARRGPARGGLAAQLAPLLPGQPATADAGSRVKLQVLAMAVRRLNSERDRRQRHRARADRVAAAG